MNSAITDPGIAFMASRGEGGADFRVIRRQLIFIWIYEQVTFIARRSVVGLETNGKHDSPKIFSPPPTLR